MSRPSNPSAIAAHTNLTISIPSPTPPTPSDASGGAQPVPPPAAPPPVPTPPPAPASKPVGSTATIPLLAQPAAPSPPSAPPAAAAASPLSPRSQSPNGPASSMHVAFAVFSYGLSSLSGVFVNKACLSAYQFNHPLTLLLCQLTVSLTCLTVCRSLGLVTIADRPVTDVPRLIVPAVSFVANVTIGLVALRLVNIPMFSAFRRLSVLSVMLVEYIVLRTVPSRRVFSTVFVMAFGSFLAGLGDVSYDPLGYTLVFANNFITAANLVAIKKSSTALSLSALSMFFYVSLLALPLVTLLAVATGDLRHALRDIFCTRAHELQSPGFIFALSCSAASAFLINFFTNLCTQLTSPLTTAITGQMKNILQTVLGIFAFGYIVTPLNLFGLSIALTGSLLFARVKFLDGKVKQKQAAAAAASKAGDMDPPPKGASTTTKLTTHSSLGKSSVLPVESSALSRPPMGRTPSRNNQHIS